MAYLIPSIVHRLEQNLIALDACKMLKLDIHPDLALEAFTKDSENQSEDNGRESMEAFEPINFQPGMGNNYVSAFLFLPKILTYHFLELLRTYHLKCRAWWLTLSRNVSNS